MENRKRKLSELEPLPILWKKRKRKLSEPQALFDEVESGVEKLPLELWDHINQYLPVSDASRFAKTCKKAFLFGCNSKTHTFYNKYIHTTNQNVQKLLLHVARGEQGEAEAMLKEEPSLLLEKDTVIDLSGRKFENITAFQIALWNLDRHMWEMIQKHLSPYQNEIVKQLREHQSKDNPPAYVIAQGRHFNFQPIKNAYQTYLNYYNQVDWRYYSNDFFKGCYSRKIRKELDSLWLEIGKEQRLLPAHVIHEYFRHDRTFIVNNRAPAFDETYLPRKTIFYDGLGDFTLIRAARVVAGRSSNWWAMGSSYLLDDVGPADFAAVSSLCEVRADEFKQLEKQYLNQAFEQPSKVYSKI